MLYVHLEKKINHMILRNKMHYMLSATFLGDSK